MYGVTHVIIREALNLFDGAPVEEPEWALGSTISARSSDDQLVINPAFAVSPPVPSASVSSPSKFANHQPSTPIAVPSPPPILDSNPSLEPMFPELGGHVDRKLLEEMTCDPSEVCQSSIQVSERIVQHLAPALEGLARPVRLPKSVSFIDVTIIDHVLTLRVARMLTQQGVIPPASLNVRGR